MEYKEFLSYFTVKKSTQDKAQCICPAHNDKQASLSITRKDNKILMHCHAGCDPSDILSAVGLSMKDLYKDDLILEPEVERWKSYVEEREKRKIEDIYSYVDFETGKYVFSRLRLKGKIFRYGIIENDRFTYGLNRKSRKSIPAIFCKDYKKLKEAIASGNRVFYCEGEKDVKTISKYGLVGVTCGASGDWTKVCAPLFKGTDVVILQDNDAPGEKMAKQIENDIKTVAKSVRIIVPTPEIEHGDITDYFTEHSVDDFEALLKETTVEDDSGSIDLDQFHLINDKGRVTGAFDLAVFEYLKRTENIKILGGIPYIYHDGVFSSDHTGAELKTMIRKLIYPEFVKSTTIKRIYDLFISDSDLQVRFEDMNQYPAEWINFRNGFYDPKSKQMIEHDPKYKATNQIPHVYDPEGQLKGMAVQKWLSFIGDTSEDVEMLCQFAGLCLTRDTRQQKSLILNGEAGTGKSTVIRMIDKMIGPENISNISLSQLTQRFSAFGLMGKLLNSCADLEIDALSDVSTLKKVLGEDTLSAEAKGKDAISFVSYAKLIFSTNELPIVKAEKTNGFYRRLLILTMNRVPENKDTEFFDRLSNDIDDFIRLSVTALDRMYQNGRITESRSSVEAVKRLRCDSDTVEAFLSDEIVESQGGRIKKVWLYDRYERYCKDMERQSLTKQNFYRSMRAKGFSEIKSNDEYFKGIEFKKNLPKTSQEISQDDHWEAPENIEP